MSVAASPEVHCPPTHLWVPPGSTFEAGAEAADLARDLGYQVDQPERDALNVLLAESPDGEWAAMESGIVAPRQNVKTAMLEVTCWRDLLIRDVRRVTWSAHLYKTTRDAFKDMKLIVDSHDWVRSRVNKVRESNGEEGFEFVNGATLDFLARSKGSGRGLGGDTVVLDEALYLSTDTQGALIPTLSTARKAHVRYGSSPGKLESSALRALRDRARTMSDPSLAWVEWSTPEIVCVAEDCAHELDAPGCMLDDEDQWARVNVALDRRITRRYVRAERRALATDPWEFLRERMGVWQDPPPAGADHDDVLDNWGACADPTAAPVGPIALALVVAHDQHGPAASIVACGAGADGRPTFEVVDYESGQPTWLLPRLAELRERHTVTAVGVVDGSPAAALPGLPEDVARVKGTEFAAACQSLAQDVAAGMVRHRDQRSMRIAIDKAARRFSGDGWRWSLRESRADISPLVGAVVARHLWVTADQVDRSPAALLNSFG